MNLDEDSMENPTSLGMVVKETDGITNITTVAMAEVATMAAMVAERAVFSTDVWDTASILDERLSKELTAKNNVWTWNNWDDEGLRTE